MKSKVLDLFCGMGGWSIGFHREGFECVGLDIVDVGYPYEFWKGDIREFACDSKMGFDVVVASPPCTEYASITKLSYLKGQRSPPDPYGPKGVGLVKETKRIIDSIQPKFWIAENVMLSREYIEPILGKPILEAKPWLLWGNLNGWMFPQEPKKHDKQFHQLNDWQRGKGGNRIGLPEDFPFDPLKSWKRARIPIWLSQTIAKGCKESLALRLESKDEKK